MAESAASWYGNNNTGVTISISICFWHKVTASSANAEAVFCCQHVLMITAKMPAAATEERIFLMFLPLGMEKKKQY